MTAPMVLIMFWISLCFVDSSYGTMHRVRMTAEIVAVTLCDLPFFYRVVGCSSINAFTKANSLT
jgi:hypothetical protein